MTDHQSGAIYGNITYVKQHPFAENLDRLLGLHRMTAGKASDLLGVSKTTISYWRNGRRQPDSATIVKRIGDLFGIDPFDLLSLPFAELLPRIGDPGRFAAVESRIHGGQASETNGLSPGHELLEMLKDAAAEGIERRKGAIKEG